VWCRPGCDQLRASFLVAHRSPLVCAVICTSHVRYRLRRLEELTNRSLADPLDLAELHVALECARMLGVA
jgi:hypothetical protein